MASCLSCDVGAWILSLPNLNQWKKDTMTLSICSSNSSSATLNLTIAKIPSSTSISFSLTANFGLPFSLWTSKPVPVQSTSSQLLDEEATHNLLMNCIQDVLKYGPNKNGHLYRIPKHNSNTNFKAIFNIAFLTLAFLVCIYEAPGDLRSSCLYTITDQLTAPQSREASKLLMRQLGSSIEEQWLRSLNLAITNWKMEWRAANYTLRTPSSLFSHAMSTFGLWKVQLYCPVIAMEIENSSGSADERLLFSLNYHQLEGVIQLKYRVIIHEKWADVIVEVDNIRLDVVGLLNETLMEEKGAGAAEKPFPSRISLQLTPTLQAEILSVSVSKSSDNPQREVGVERSVEGSIEPPNTYLGLKVSAGETTTTVLKPWKFEESARGDSGNLNWFLHDSADGREVFSSRPSKVALFQPKAWFKNRYTSAYRPFTRQGGVIFAGDEYGESVCWKMDKSAIGKRMEWEIRGCVGLTYWPNRYRTSYNETRRADFKETLYLTLA